MPIKFLTGRDYPHVYAACQRSVDQAVENLLVAGEDTDDNEAPLMFAADHRFLCGPHGRECQLGSDFQEECGGCGERKLTCPDCKAKEPCHCECAPLATLQEAKRRAAQLAYADLIGATPDPFSAVQWMKSLPKEWQKDVREVIVYVYHNEKDPPGLA